MKAKSNNLSVDATIFEQFNKLTSDDEKVRIKGASGLIKILEETSDEKVQKQLDYALKRLIRGNGSSTSCSRIGFHTALTGLLNSNFENPPKISNIVEILRKEFHGVEEKGKVDSLVGTSLVCGAIIRSDKTIGNASKEEVEDVTKCLASCLGKNSVSSLAFSFLNELVIKSTTDIVSSIIWPVVKKHVSIAKDKITIDPLYLLLVIEEHHENVIDTLFCKKLWQSESILCTDNLEAIANLLWSNKNTAAVNHPFYVYFMRRLTNEKLLKSFWGHVDEMLESSTKPLELITIHSAISIFKNLEEKPKEVLKILTPNFLKMLSANGTKSMRDEDLQEMYTELFDLFDKRFQALKKEETKLQALKIFAQSLTIEKSSTKKFISNLINSLELDGLKTAISGLKSIIISNIDERERQYAASIFQKLVTTNKLVSSNIEWRIEQLNYLVNLAIFKSANGVDLSTSDDDINSNSGNIKNIFYHCLEYKLPKLDDEKTVLLGIINHINGHLTKKDPNKFLQKPLKPSHLERWKKMFAQATENVDKKDKKLQTVFQVLMLHMGLQLFNNSDVAENAIGELESVTKRALQKKRKDNEPDWIEVVIDLFLTLLSQESYVLRNVIRHVFPQLCGQMTVTAFHQILSLLDLNSKDNPLMNGNDEDDAMDEDEASDEEDSDDDQPEEETEEVEDSDDAEDIEDDGNETINESVRAALQNALGTSGDGDDIDLDDMDEEEGNKLDLALADAFKLLKQSRKPKETKADKIAEKTLLHFRMRALDLVEIYLKNNPQMEICLETLIFFFDLMPIAIKNEKQTPLLPRFDGIFMQLSQLKSFSLETVANVTSKNLAETLTNLLQKTIKEKTNIQQLNHFARACIFLINCSQILQKLTPGEDEVLRIMLEHLREFFTHRNPTMQLSSFNKILATQWNGNFKMAKFIADEGLRSTVRSLRRTQSLQMLKTFFKNHNLFTQNDKHAVKYSEKVAEHLKTYASEVQEMPQPELLELMQFILAMRQKKDFSANDNLVAAVQRSRQLHQLKPNILNIYKSFCNVFKITFVPNEKIENGATKETTEAQSKVNGNGDVEKPENGTAKRKKNSNKEKKLKKQQRLIQASKGFNESFSFSSTQEVMLE